MSRNRKRAGAALAALAAVAVVVTGLGLPGGRAEAQITGERVKRMDVTVSVNGDGTLFVEERILYDFGASFRHGIYRLIPDRYRWDPEPAFDRVTPIDGVSVTSPDAPAGVTLGRSGRYRTIRVGDPDTTISGEHSYVIRYRVRGVFNRFPRHDELFWEPTGYGWEVPIDEVTTRVLLPTGATEVACFAGPLGSRSPCPRAGIDGATARFAASRLGPYSGLSVVIALPRGTIQPAPAPILRERWSLARAFRPSAASLGLTSIAMLIVGLGAVTVWKDARDRRYRGGPVAGAMGGVDGITEILPLFDRSEIPVEFEPPDELRPGQVGTLVDETANPLDVTATIVDLAVRGYLRIEEAGGGGLFSKPDWRLVLLKPNGDGLLDYERLLFEELHRRDGGAPPALRLSDLRDTFAASLKHVQDALYADVMHRGWFDERPDRVRSTWQVIGVIALVVSGAAAFAVIRYTTLALAVIPLVLGAIALLAAGRRMPRRTAQGHAALRRTLGFRRFIEESEVHRARFAEDQHLFTEYLPYAVVFGATDKWAKAFAGLAGEPPDTSAWYIGPGSFDPVVFSSRMDSFAVTTAGTITSVPAAAGASGGSGFGGGGGGGGGGGFGGGGGGSW